jgi:hypothetical protein
MADRRKKRRGPVTVFVDWFMVDPITTGVVMAPLVVFACIAAYLTIRAMISGHF